MCIRDRVKGGIYELSIGPFSDKATSLEFKVMVYDSQGTQLGVSDMITLTFSEGGDDGTSGTEGNETGGSEEAKKGSFIPGFEAPVLALALTLCVMAASEARRRQ